jgi:hypothetical protein
MSLVAVVLSAPRRACDAAGGQAQARNGELCNTCRALERKEAARVKAAAKAKKTKR